MPALDSKTTVQHLTGLRQRLDSLRTHFHYIESVFSHAFQRHEEKPWHNGFAELYLLSQFLLRYAELRRAPDFLDGLTALLHQVGERDLAGDRPKELNEWMAEMACHEEDDRLADCLVTWQQTSKAFLSYIESQSNFVDKALRTLNPMLNGERDSSVLVQRKTDGP